MSTPVFPNLVLEPIVQTNDKTRLDASRSFAVSGSFTSVTIQPDTGEDVFDVTLNKYIDWQYAASGAKTVTLTVVTDLGASGSVTEVVSVLTPAQDYLFSSDSDLKLEESDILKWLPEGRNSYIDVHRRAQTLIMKWLEKEGYENDLGDPYKKSDIINVEEVRNWSMYQALTLIFENMGNAKDDIFAQKTKYYQSKQDEWKSQLKLKLDSNKDGVVDINEDIDTQTGFVARR